VTLLPLRNMDSTSSSHHLHKNPMVSPPEAIPYDSFVSPPLTATRYSSSEPMTSIHQHSKMDISPPAVGPPKNMASLLSPPPSPFTRGVPATTETTVVMPDPTLFSAPNSPALASQRPLFDDEEQFADLISKRASPSANQDPKLKPTVQEYSVFVSAAFELCRRDPGKWLEREKKLMANVPTQWASLNRVQKVSAGPSTTIGRTLAPARKQMPTSSPAKVQRIPRTPKPTLKFQGGIEGLVRAQNAGTISPGSANAARTRQPATREDTDFDAIPNYCPPLSTLNENSKFRVEWKGTPLDLSNDPHRHLLHPAEVNLASILRLSCASYLTSKRRIFNEKIIRYRQGMEFRKTDSQKACKIDVNKASKLWSAYEKIGWFDPRFITPHL